MYYICLQSYRIILNSPFTILNYFAFTFTPFPVSGCSPASLR